MKLRTSCFDKTLLRKNITRFSPLWGMYLVCLVIGLGLMYMNADNRMMNFWFASYMAECIQVMGLVNLFFAPVAAVLLFGDLFQSRMCNALHAMPVRRETIFFTNAVSGLLFSGVPTAVMALLSMPLLMATVVKNAWQIALLWFVAANLEFLCFFGLAVLCIFCTGNKLGFGAAYAALNGGAFLIYALADTLYTPMLFGVETPIRLVEWLTPVARMLDETFVEVENYYQVLQRLAGPESRDIAAFQVNPGYAALVLYALAGLVCLGLGLVLYRRRNLECAGDAVALRWLEPVFQLISALAGAAMAMLCMELFFYRMTDGPVMYVMALLGMAMGWFAGKMILERSPRVFRLKTWLGLAVLAVVFGVSLVMTRLDVFGIETWIPRAEKVESITLHAGGESQITERQDIENIIRLHEMALEDRLERQGAYPASYVDSFGTRSHIPYPEEGFAYGEEGGYDVMEDHYYADYISILYRMESGREVRRNYSIWAGFEEGQIIRQYASRWEVVSVQAGIREDRQLDFSRIQYFMVNGNRAPEALITEETVLELLDAIRADCAEGNMVDDSYYHQGRFRMKNDDPTGEQPYYYSSQIYLDIVTYTGPEKDQASCWFQIYPDSTHTINWLREHGLLNCEIVEGTFPG